MNAETSHHGASEEHTELPEAIAEQIKDKLSNSALGAAAQQDQPTGFDLLKAVGGVRGLVETTLPPLIFLAVFFMTNQDLVLSVTIPFVVAAIFIVIRVLTQSELTSSISGAVGLGLSAALALMSGNLENNFLLGIITNIVLFILFMISLFFRRPVIGIVGAMLMDASQWRDNPRQLRLMMLATALWCGMFLIRISVQLPLYLTENAAGLALVKVILGLPLYALMLWATWLLLRAAFLATTSKR